MAKYALVAFDGIRVNQVVDSKEECFDVHTNLRWVEGPDSISLDYDYIDGEFVERPKPTTTYAVARKVGYGDIGEQFGSIYDAIQNGDTDIFATWAENQRKIKILFPKDNEDAVQAAQEEVSQRQHAYYESLTAQGLPIDKKASDFVLQVADDYIAGRWNNPITGPYTA